MAELLFDTGTEVPVEVLADSTGDVATEGQGVALVGENESAVTVELVESVSDRCVGILKNDPSALHDPGTTESDIGSGSSAGMADVILAYPIFWMDADSGYSPTVTDYVQVGDGGDIESFTGPTASGLGGAVTNTLGVDGNGALETNAASDIDVDFTNDAFPFGMVFTTVAREWGVGGKTAVIKGVF